MKLIIITCLIIVLFSVNGFSDDNIIDIGIVNAKSGLVLREKPTINSKKICVIPFNNEVYIYEYTKNRVKINNITSRWARVRIFDQKGWMFCGYLDIERYSMQELRKSFNRKKIIFREADSCEGYLPTEFWAELTFFPSGKVQYYLNGVTNYDCPGKSNKEKCENIGYNATIKQYLIGNYKLNHSTIDVSFNKETTIYIIDEECCPKNNIIRKESKISRHYIFKMTTCELKNFQRVTLTSEKFHDYQYRSWVLKYIK